MARGRKKRDKSIEPSKETAAIAMEMIKTLQKEKDEAEELAKIEKEKEKEKQRLAEINKQKIAMAQEKVRKVLKENLRKKEEEASKKNVKSYLELNISPKSKIVWKSMNEGRNIFGVIDEKNIFEIVKGLTTFNLYTKDKELIKEFKKSYLGCSSYLDKLKEKSEKIIFKREGELPIHSKADVMGFKKPN